jgi:hypothetical protein
MNCGVILPRIALYDQRMIFVEPHGVLTLTTSPYFPVTWASDVTVCAQGENLLVTGKLPLLDSDIQSARDPYLGYVRSVKAQFAQKQTGKRSPHIRFANAITDKELIAFVKEFGPVVATGVSIIEGPDPEHAAADKWEHADLRSTITAVQTLPTLRAEQQTFAAGLRLMFELKRGSDRSDTNAVLRHVNQIAEGVSHWPNQYETERVWRLGQYSGPPTWQFDAKDLNSFATWQSQVQWRLQFDNTPKPDRPKFVFRPTAESAGHDVLCGLVNAFRTEVQRLKDRTVDALSLFSLRFGIRPALYVILKNEYLGRGGTLICGNDRCGEFFVSERTGQHYCSPACSQQHRQRRYWKMVGARKRGTRRAKVRERN